MGSADSWLVTATTVITAASATAIVVDVLPAVRRSAERWARRLVGQPLPEPVQLHSSELWDRFGDVVAQVERALTSGPQTLEDRLARLGDLMAEAALLNNQVSAELEARAATAKKLQEDAEQAEAIAAINREQADAVRMLMEADLAGALAVSGKAIERNVRRDAIRIGAASFVLGGGLTLLITLLVHPLG
jgi:hypothetical protein